MAISKKTIKDIDIKGKKIIMRVDFNVPIKNGVINDDTRIKAALPSIKYILENGAKSLVLMSHLGDPKKDSVKAKEKAGDAWDEAKYMEGQHKMAPIAAHLGKLIGKTVKVTPDCMSDETKNMVSALADGEVLLLENTRFHKEETAKEGADRDVMAKVLAGFGDVYVNDAFGTAHRDHASTASICKFMNGPCVAGFLMEKELEFLDEKIVKNPVKPFVAIVGGAKVSSKITVIESLMEKVDSIIIGGGMAFTFFKAMGMEVGKSLCEDDQIETAKKTMEAAKSKGVKFLLQTDVVAADAFSNDAANIVTVSMKDMPKDMMGLDIGPETIKTFNEELSKAKTIFWNGPVGVFEMEKYAKGTLAIADTLANLKDATTIIGGGDSVSAVNKAGVADKMTHISTGGGASLELVEGKVLPGVASLNNK